MDSKHPSRQAGVALFTAILVVALAAVIAASLAARQHLDIRRTENLAHMDQAWQYVGGIEAWALGRLKEDLDENKIDGAKDMWTQPISQTEVDGGRLQATIQDLQGRFNLNNLLAEGQPQPLEITRLTRLLAALEIAPDFIPALLDWLDADSDPRFPGGAEDEVYQGLQPPYRAANHPLASVDELLWVQGVGAETYAKLRPFVTALPAPTKININTAPAPVLMALTDRVSEADAKALIETRTEEPFDKMETFLLHPALAGREITEEGLDLSSTWFQVDGDVQVGRIILRHASLLNRPGGEKPSRVIQRVRKGLFDDPPAVPADGGKKG